MKILIEASIIKLSVAIITHNDEIAEMFIWRGSGSP